MHSILLEIELERFADAVGERRERKLGHQLQQFVWRQCDGLYVAGTAWEVYDFGRIGGESLDVLDKFLQRRCDSRPQVKRVAFV